MGSVHFRYNTFVGNFDWVQSLFNLFFNMETEMAHNVL